jgi:hypothetical protein
MKLLILELIAPRWPARRRLVGAKRPFTYVSGRL